jgi:hypothetical protein
MSLRTRLKTTHNIAFIGYPGALSAIAKVLSVFGHRTMLSEIQPRLKAPAIDAILSTVISHFGIFLSTFQWVCFHLFLFWG